MAGYPMLTVPCGLVDGLPVGLGFVGLADHERVLLRIGHAYEIAAFGPAGSAAAFPPRRMIDVSVARLLPIRGV